MIIRIDSNEREIKNDGAIRYIREALSDETKTVAMFYFHESLISNSLINYHHKSVVNIQLEENHFIVRAGVSYIKKSYGEQLTKKERNALVKSEVKRHQEAIEQELEEHQQSKEEK